MAKDERIDAYIARQADFARPILTVLRDAVARHCPGAHETIKWGSPAWTYRDKLLCGMAAFKAHATFGFWRGAEVTGETGRAHDAMGQFGRMTTPDDLPDDASLGRLIGRAADLIDSGVSAPRTLKRPKPDLIVPPALANALEDAPEAAKTFTALSPSHRREYVEWITEAKRDETRDRRIAQAIAWLAEGKSRNWKYAQC